ncbi:hypothetical protein B9Z19DRAFT_1096425 [Tuber borchii]|uniref:Ubiquitin 3 binding protein But2 C-terminal domain-containing protein n=1 Tax=Tuber borchii TaxID=42251 RepID=A0A2T6ZBK8_TUBBO|nr:hypothetical protein B9Z19DRAFT_1096425 [Tuber borchii]
MRVALATCAILATAALSWASSAEVVEQQQHVLYLYSEPQTGHEDYQHLMPTILVPIKESHRHHPFTSATSGRVYFSGDKSTKDEERMLVSFRVPPDESVGRCFLSFFHKLGYSGGAGEEEGDGVEAGIRGRGQMYAYKLREEIFIGKTTYHGRPRRESDGVVFGISVPLEGGYADVSDQGVQCAPGETITFEIVPDREIGMVDVCWNQEAEEEDEHFVESGIGLRVISEEWFCPEDN